MNQQVKQIQESLDEVSKQQILNAYRKEAAKADQQMGQKSTRKKQSLNFGKKENVNEQAEALEMQLEND